MKMNLGYKLTQEQKLALTQEMQLSIRVLQMSINDLREYIDNEFAENPVLEIKDREEDVSFQDNEKLMGMIKYLDGGDYKGESYVSYDRDEETSPLNFISKEKSLKDYLCEQINDIEEDPFIKEIANYIVESLDNRGYLEITVEEISKEIGLSIEEVLQALDVVHNLEPFGIGARNLKECLKLQLINLGLIDDILESIIENHLEDIANGKYAAIGKELGLSLREVQRYVDVIRKLEPKPSRGFYTGEDTKFIIPDGEIRVVDNEILILMNDGVLPKLSVNKIYKEILETSKDNNTTDYVKEKFNKAMSLVKSIEQRRGTLYRVIEKIIEKQPQCFLKGMNYLKPMILKEIAEEIEVHESTVSRAIKDKYLLTSFGTVRIKDLFTLKLNNSQGEEDKGILAIKNRIKELINNEDKKKPLSDQVICEMLNREKINISRRTVAKYREEGGILSSSKRKRV